MTDSEFIETVREQNKTELSRLGSSKALYADTQGELEDEEVLQAVATAEHAAQETFESWAAEENGDSKAAFEESAGEEQEHYESVCALVDGHEPGAVPEIQSYLREQTDTIERVGAFIGRTIVAEKSKEQVIAFFVGQADPQTAQTFREMGSDLEAQLERTDALLNDSDTERALEAASGAIEAAYEEYTEQLESMGVNPKPVC